MAAARINEETGAALDRISGAYTAAPQGKRYSAVASQIIRETPVIISSGIGGQLKNVVKCLVLCAKLAQAAGETPDEPGKRAGQSGGLEEIRAQLNQPSPPNTRSKYDRDPNSDPDSTLN